MKPTNMSHPESLAESTGTVIEPAAALPAPNPDAVLTEPAAAAPAPNPGVVEEPPAIAVEIPRDLAVQLVGSDAGKCRRCRPHGAMTRNAPAPEVSAVEAVMEGFLQDEIKRVHQDSRHRPKIHRAMVSAAQALALRAFCARYGGHLRAQIAKPRTQDELRDAAQFDRGDSHRNRNRLTQVETVIEQINVALGLDADDAKRRLNLATDSVVDQMMSLYQELEALKVRAFATAPEPHGRPANVIQFAATLKVALQGLGRLQQTTS